MPAQFNFQVEKCLKIEQARFAEVIPLNSIPSSSDVITRQFHRYNWHVSKHLKEKLNCEPSSKDCRLIYMKKSAAWRLRNRSLLLCRKNRCFLEASHWRSEAPSQQNKSQASRPSRHLGHCATHSCPTLANVLPHQPTRAMPCSPIRIRALTARVRPGAQAARGLRRCATRTPGPRGNRGTARSRRPCHPPTHPRRRLEIPVARAAVAARGGAWARAAAGCAAGGPGLEETVGGFARRRIH